MDLRSFCMITTIQKDFSPSLCLTQNLDPINRIQKAPSGPGKDYTGKVIVMVPANGINIVWAINNENE